MDRFTNIAHLYGIIVKWLGTLLVVPAAVALGYGTAVLPFLIPLVGSVVVGYGLQRFFPERDLRRPDGFLLVVAVWVGISILGAIPYVLSGIGTLADPLNAFFESASGFTCTGSTVMGEISLDKYPHALLLWRQFTQWLGGMGILALAVAILPRLSVGGAQFLDDEVPGPQMDRLTPHIAQTARRLWFLYAAATGVLFVLLMALHVGGLAPEMDLFQSVAHALTTLPSGGFSPQARSVEAFAPAVQWVIIPFMFVAAMNFALLWRAIFERRTVLLQNTEFKVYTALFILGAGITGMMLLGLGEFSAVETSLRQGAFQFATFLTTTGYASTDFATWPSSITVLLVTTMFISGCVGSTSGGLKLMRWIVGLKVVVQELFERVHPSGLFPLRLGPRVLKSNIVRGALILIVAYLGLFAISCVVVGLDTAAAGHKLSIVEIASSVAATLGNIGPGLGQFGPMENFEFLPPFSKLWMCFLMIAGRLEIMTFLVLLTPHYWKQ
jgi:trk system potassium uptake protein TrkH